MKFSLGEHRVVTRGEHWIAPGAVVIGQVELGHDVSIWFNSVLRGDNDRIVLGDGSQVQDGCVLHSFPNRELVVAGETGYLVPVGDRAAFTQFADRLLFDPALARQMGDAGRERIAAGFSTAHGTPSRARRKATPEKAVWLWK